MTIQKSTEPDAFTAFERAGWSSVISGYERVLGPVTAQTADATLSAARLAKGDRVLDVCTGHGVLASAASKMGATVRGLDFAPEVVAIARRNAPDLDFDEGDAQQLPYPAESFDKVICGYGIIHLPDPQRALAEMHRVLRPGGRVALSVWDRPEPTNGLGLLFGAVKAHGKMDVPLPHGPDFFQFSDPDRFKAALSNAGFINAEVKLVPQAWILQRAEDFLPSILEGTVRAKALLRAQEDEAFERISAAIANGLAQLGSNRTGYHVPMPALVGSGERELR